MLPIWITTLPKLDNWQEHYDDLHNQCLNYVGPWLSSNFEIQDPKGVWAKVYDQFIDKTQEILGPLNIHHNVNKRSCWLYSMNRKFYKGGIHHHINSSIVNAVYYFSIPDITDYRDSAIAFYDKNDEEFWHYKPREGDLVIFPNYLKHQPLPTKSEKFRFSINMEIICDWPKAFGTAPEGGCGKEDDEVV